MHDWSSWWPIAQHVQATAGMQQQDCGSRWPVARSILFKEVAVLGSGNFSRVYRVVGRVDGCEYAIKRSTRPLQCDASRRQWVQVGPVPAQHLLGSASPDQHDH